jgi:CheY-like chemotaxis protein
MEAAAEDMQALHVLLVEDDLGDVLLVEEAFGLSPASCHLHVVNDGKEAIGFVRRTGAYSAAPRPGLILLDLNLPGLGGLQVLAQIKADDELKTIPVVVLTTSQAPEDIQRSYDLHTNAYVTKPTGLDPFISTIRRIDEMFLGLIARPA